MGDKSLISIIVPVYNLEEYVQQCVEGILAQSYREFELIIVDDGSTDNTYDLCCKYAEEDKRVRVFHQKNSGVVLARRKGLEVATGEYVTFVDGDDWVEPDLLQVMADNIDDSDMVCCGAIWEEKQGDFFRKRDSFSEGLYEGESLDSLKSKMLFDLESGLSQSLTAWLWAKMYKLSKFMDIEGFVNPDIFFYEDALLVYRYAVNCNKIAFVEAYPYHYRYRSDSASHRKDSGALININNVYKGLLDIAENSFDLYKLREQADNWLIEKCYFTLNERMGLKTEGRVIRYLLDQSGLNGRRIAIYGAGRVGRDAYAQLMTSDHKVVLWVDKSAKEICDDRIRNVKELLKADFDIVLIAIESRRAVKEIETELIEQGVSQSKILSANIQKLF